jgi:NodT family efflux transporter outer membrane factor (OMF) lipoprotein
MRLGFHAALTGLALPLAACTVGPDHAPPQLPSSAALASGAFLRAGATSAQAPARQWWAGLNDPELSRLIETGLAGSPRLSAAEARIRQARAGLARARANRLPLAGASLMAVHADLPQDALGTSTGQGSDLYAAGFDAQWELDLWGGGRRSVEKGLAEAQAAQAGLADAQVQLSAEIARTYVDLRERESRLALLQRRLDLESRQLRLVQSRRQGGTAPQQQVEAASIRARTTEAMLAALRADAIILRDALAVLTGQAPGAFDGLSAGSIPLPPAEVAVGDPAAMLARRPDLRAAELRLAASSALIGVAQARRLPAISLIGLIGIGGTSPGDLASSSSLASIAVPRLSWSFLDFGRSLAALRGARAGRDEALANYQETLLAALQDAEASLAHFGAARIAYGHALGNLDSAARIAGFEDMRADAGTLSHAEALEAGIRAIDADLAVLAERAGLTRGYIALAKSLGLGWQESPAAELP